MNIKRYDISRFVNRVKDKDRFDILQESSKEVKETEASITGGLRGAPDARKAGAGEYAEMLKGLIYYLSNGKFPGGIEQLTFSQYFKPIIEKFPPFPPT